MQYQSSIYEATPITFYTETTNPMLSATAYTDKSDYDITTSNHLPACSVIPFRVRLTAIICHTNYWTAILNNSHRWPKITRSAALIISRAKNLNQDVPWMTRVPYLWPMIRIVAPVSRVATLNKGTVSLCRFRTYYLSLDRTEFQFAWISNVRIFELGDSSSFFFFWCERQRLAKRLDVRNVTSFQLEVLP